MNRFFSLVVCFPIFFVLILIASFVGYQQQALTEMHEIMVAAAANSASDAAVFASRRVAHVDLYGRTTLDPEFVWAEYKRTFLRSMNLFSLENMERFESYSVATIIAVNDGYFVRMRTVDYNHPSGSPQAVFRWSQKIPFARQVNHNGVDVVVADTMNGAYIFGLVLSGMGAGQPMVWGNDVPVPDVRGGIHDSRAIALELIQVMDYLIEVENASLTNNLWDRQRFYIPMELIDTLYYATVSFEGLSIINLIQGFDMLGGGPVDYFTISNTQLVEARQYVCFVDDDGMWLYRPLHDGSVINANDPRVIIVVPTREQAARLGFFPDPAYYQLPLPNLR